MIFIHNRLVGLYIYLRTYYNMYLHARRKRITQFAAYGAASDALPGEGVVSPSTDRTSTHALARRRRSRFFTTANDDGDDEV